MSSTPRPRKKTVRAEQARDRGVDEHTLDDQDGLDDHDGLDADDAHGDNTVEATDDDTVEATDGPDNAEAAGTGDVVVDQYQSEILSRRQAAIANARRRGGAASAALAGVMLTMQEMIEGEKEDAPVVVEANSDPEDMDADGITVSLGDDDYYAPPLDRIDNRDDGART